VCRWRNDQSGLFFFCFWRRIKSLGEALTGVARSARFPSKTRAVPRPQPRIFQNSDDAQMPIPRLGTGWDGLRLARRGWDTKRRFGSFCRIGSLQHPGQVWEKVRRGLRIFRLLRKRTPPGGAWSTSSTDGKGRAGGQRGVRLCSDGGFRWGSVRRKLDPLAGGFDHGIGVGVTAGRKSRTGNV